jgi:hypothetical protein
MKSPQPAHFSRRHNLDGTHDSICSICMLTVASGRDDAGLERDELDHKCDPVLLYQFSQGRRPASFSVNHLLAAK